MLISIIKGDSNFWKYLQINMHIITNTFNLWKCASKISTYGIIKKTPRTPFEYKTPYNSSTRRNEYENAFSELNPNEMCNDVDIFRAAPLKRIITFAKCETKRAKYQPPDPAKYKCEISNGDCLIYEIYFGAAIRANFRDLRREGGNFETKASFSWNRDAK